MRDSPQAVEEVRVGGELEQAGEQEEDLFLYTSYAAAERSSVDLGGRRIIKKKNNRI